MKQHIILLLVVLATACQPTENVKIGIATPLTGGAAFLGENVVNSATLTLEEYGFPYELVIEDVPCGGHGADAVKAVSRLIDRENVQFIVGGMCSDELLAVAPILNEDHVVLIMPLTGGQNVDEAGPYVFRNGPSDIIAGTKPAEELTDIFGARSVALVADNVAYARDIVRHFQSSFPGEIAVEEYVDVGETGLQTVVTKIRESGAEAVLVTTQDGVSAAHLIRQLAEQGAAVPVFGNFLTYTPWLREIAQDAQEGVYVYDPEFSADDEVRVFFSRYETRFGKAPSIPFHTTGVRDAIVMFSQAERAVGDDGEAIRNWLLENIQDWDGFNGEVSFDEQGNSGTGFVRKQIVNGELV